MVWHTLHNGYNIRLLVHCRFYLMRAFLGHFIRLLTFLMTFSLHVCRRFFVALYMCVSAPWMLLCIYIYVCLCGVMLLDSIGKDRKCNFCLSIFVVRDIVVCCTRATPCYNRYDIPLQQERTENERLQSTQSIKEGNRTVHYVWKRWWWTW